MTEPRFARSGNSSPYGKRSEPVKALVAYEVKAELGRRVAVGGFSSESELVAILLEGALFGVDHAAKVQSERVYAAFGKGPESDRKGQR